MVRMPTLRLSRRQILNALSTTAAFGVVPRASHVAHAAPTTDAAGQTSSPPASAGSLTDVAGIRVGHFTDTRRPTGCTVILFDKPATAGADYDGSAPGESLGVMLQPVSPLDQIHALLLTGGGPMALGATAGVVRFLEERGVGYDWGVPNVRIPIVVGAVIDDLSLGDGRIRVGPDEAYRACEVTSTAAVAEGSVGAGAGATVGKMFVRRGMRGMKGGLGCASTRLGDVVVSALAVVNAAGDVLDWRQGTVVAGARTADGSGFARTVDVLRRDLVPPRAAAPLADDPLRATTLVVVATNVSLTKTQLTKLAMMVNTGAARAINPYHTQGDGDQVLAISTGAAPASSASLTALGAIGAEVVADAIVRAVRTATSVPGWTAARDL
jgi:L-aminopeptidase/D-esterase-like protein